MVVGWLDGWMVGWLDCCMVRLLDVWMVKFLISWIGLLDCRMIEYKIIKIADFFESIKVSGNITCIAILNTSYMTFSRANFVYSPPLPPPNHRGRSIGGGRGSIG